MIPDEDQRLLANTRASANRLQASLAAIGVPAQARIDIMVIGGIKVQLQGGDADTLAAMVDWWAEFTPTQRQQILDGRRRLRGVQTRPIDPDYDPRIDAAEDRARGWDG